MDVDNASDLDLDEGDSDDRIASRIHEVDRKQLPLIKPPKATSNIWSFFRKYPEKYKQYEGLCVCLLCKNVADEGGGEGGGDVVNDDDDIYRYEVNYGGRHKATSH